MELHVAPCRGLQQHQPMIELGPAGGFTLPGPSEKVQFQGGNIAACHDLVAHFACHNRFRIDASQFASPARKSSIGVLLPPLT
jgi:hypothetical protein